MIIDVISYNIGPRCRSIQLYVLNPNFINLNPENSNKIKLTFVMPNFLKEINNYLFLI